MSSGKEFEFSAMLRIFGEELKSHEVTRLLGVSPSRAFDKGDPIATSTGNLATRKIGVWILKSGTCMLPDADRAIREVIDRIEVDGDVWKQATSSGRVEVVCGVFVEKRSGMLRLRPDTIARVAELNADFVLNWYYITGTVPLDSKCPCDSGRLYRDCCHPAVPVQGE